MNVHSNLIIIVWIRGDIPRQQSTTYLLSCSVTSLGAEHIVTANKTGGFVPGHCQTGPQPLSNHFCACTESSSIAKASAPCTRFSGDTNPVQNFVAAKPLPQRPPFELCVSQEHSSGTFLGLQPAITTAHSKRRRGAQACATNIRANTMLV
ncbi:hypothetical protein L209DRAFT_752249 [Thermothelomyces heterothallicus CBS 203.75]